MPLIALLIMKQTRIYHEGLLLKMSVRVKEGFRNLGSSMVKKYLKVL